MATKAIQGAVTNAVTKVEQEPNRAFALTLLTAAAMSGDHGAMSLAVQLAGVPPCVNCGFVVQHCRCKVAA